MDSLTWLPAITTTGLLAVALWLGRQVISTRLQRSVQHEFDAKLEGLRAEFRAAEESLRAGLREKEAEVAALRSGALSALATRQAAFDKRRLEAVDQLWSSCNALAPARALVGFLSHINFDAAAKIAVKDEKARKLFGSIGGGFDLKALDLTGAAKARPFVTPMVWAIYTAMLAVAMHGAMRWFVLKEGLGEKDFADNDAIKALVVAALPHYSAHLEQYGPAVYNQVLEALDLRLLEEIHQMLSGVEADKASVNQAAEIVYRANIVQSAAQTRAV